MIENDRQLETTEIWIKRFRLLLAGWELGAPPPGIHPAIHKAERDAVASQLADLEEEAAAYRAGKAALDPATPTAVIDQMVHEAGGDPEQLAREGEATVQAQLRLHRIEAAARAFVAAPEATWHLAKFREALGDVPPAELDQELLRVARVAGAPSVLTLSGSSDSKDFRDALGFAVSVIIGDDESDVRLQTAAASFLSALQFGIYET